MSQLEQHIAYLKRALELAKNVKGKTSPNPAVGALVLKAGKVIGEGATLEAGKDHAEVVAIKKAGSNVQDATLYVTLEPCCFQGRTPPCTDLIIDKKIAKVIIGVLDPNPKVNGLGVTKLKSAGIEVEYGFLEEEINELNEDFAKYILTKKPFGIAKYAMTLDGKLATSEGDSKWISNEKSREVVHQIRNQVDGIMVGVNTVIKDNPKLTVRIEGKHKDPVRIILDSKGKTPIHSDVLTDEYRSIFVVKKNIKKSEQTDHFIKLCKEKGKQVLLDESKGEWISLKWLFIELGKLEFTSILIEGGGEVLASALKDKVIDKVLCFIAPKIILGRTGIFPFGGDSNSNMENAIPLSRIHSENIGGDTLITGYIHYG